MVNIHMIHNHINQSVCYPSIVKFSNGYYLNVDRCANIILPHFQFVREYVNNTLSSQNYETNF